MPLWISEAGEMDVKQLYGRNDMVMLEQHNKIYGSLGIAEQTILKTVEGNPAVLENPKPGVAENVITGFKMQGWTEQVQYEGNQLFDASVFDGIEWSGVRVSVDNGVITASGMSESAIWIQSANFTEEDFEKFKSGNIYVKNYKTSECNYEVGIYINNVTVKEGNSPQTIPDGYLETKPNNVYFFIDIRAGIELKGSCKPMIYQDGDGTWEPYTGGAPSPSPDYPQAITSAGKYDEETGKYQYEITLSDNADRAQNLTLTSDRPLTKWDRLEKRNGQWGWVYKSEEIESYTDESVPGEYYSTTGQLSAGAQVWYETATETFVPLTTAEQEQMNELEMYLPITVITNDVDCDMIVTYKSTQNGGE